MRDRKAGRFETKAARMRISMGKEPIRDIADLHSHLLWDIDDGASSSEEAISMLEAAKGQGISLMVCTPHLILDKASDSYCKKASSRFKQLSNLCAQRQVGIKLLQGYELMLDDNIFNMPDLHRFAIGDTGLLMFEAQPGCRAELLFDVVDWLFLKNLTPMLAHPERLDCLFGFSGRKNYEKLRSLNQIGLLLQLNASDMTGYGGMAVKRRTRRIIDDDLDFVIGSDAHSDSGRLLQMQRAVNLIVRRKGRDRAMETACRKPRLALFGEEWPL